MSQSSFPTDLRGREIAIGDLVAVPVIEQGGAQIKVGAVIEADVFGGKGVLSVAGLVTSRGLHWASDVVRLDRDPSEPIEQVLPVGTRFEATYVMGGTYEFVVLADGQIQDDDGDQSSMEGIVLASIRHVERPSAATTPSA